MKYFELFDIPVQLKVNTTDLKQKFFELSKKYHPDYFASADSTGQADSLEKSALVNEAWKTFQQTDKTIQYVLEEKGLMEKEEKYELPPDFLMEVLEINEALMDDEGATDPVLRTKIEALQNEIYEPVKKIVEEYKDDSVSAKELLQVKEYYYFNCFLIRSKYFFL